MQRTHFDKHHLVGVLHLLCSLKRVVFLNISDKFCSSDSNRRHYWSFLPLAEILSAPKFWKSIRRYHNFFRCMSGFGSVCFSGHSAKKTVVSCCRAGPIFLSNVKMRYRNGESLWNLNVQLFQFTHFYQVSLI